MEDVRFLLSEKYQEFADKIKQLFQLRKSIDKELNESREMYNKLLIAYNQIEQAVILAQKEFEKWKKECIANNTDS